MRHSTIIFSIFLVLFLSLAVFGQEKEIASVDYRVGPKDLLEISVFGLDELNKTVRVSEDGKITLPLLGEIEVKGLTKSELERKLVQLLEEKYLHNPQVTVFIREYMSKTVSVMGAVRAAVQGTCTYELLGRQTLLQIISKAGGLTSEAGDEIIVIRFHEDGTSTSMKISIDDLFIKGDTELNIPLQPDDIINIPVDKVVPVYVFGQVRSPGALQVRRSHLPTLLQAIAQAGGFAERASKGGVLIKRRDENGKEIQIKVNVKDIIKGKKEDIQLIENDVVYVPETIF